MDFIIMIIFLGLASVAAFINYYKNVPYMGVLAGILLILLGLFIGIDGGITMTICSGG